MSFVDYTATIDERKIDTERFKVNLPVVHALPDLRIQNKINDKIHDSVYKLIWNQSHGQTEQLMAEGTYRVTLNQGGIISLVVELNYSPPEGQVFRNQIKSFTFSIRDGAFYKFEDLFKNDSDFIERINKIVKRQILERGITLHRKFKTIADDEKFYLTPEAVVIYDAVYEYVKPDFGLLEFTIPLAEVQDLIYGKGPLAKLALS